MRPPGARLFTYNYHCLTENPITKNVMFYKESKSGMFAIKKIDALHFFSGKNGTRFKNLDTFFPSMMDLH